MRGASFDIRKRIWDTLLHLLEEAGEVTTTTPDGEEVLLWAEDGEPRIFIEGGGFPPSITEKDFPETAELLRDIADYGFEAAAPEIEFTCLVSHKAVVWMTDEVKFKARSRKEAEAYIRKHAEEGMTDSWDGIAELVDSSPDYDTLQYIVEDKDGGRDVLSIEFKE